MTTKTRMMSWVAAAGPLLVGSSGCGFGTAAVVSSSAAGGGASGQSVASALLAPRSPTSPASIFFVLTDQEGDAADVEIRFRQTGAVDFRPITLAPGSASLTNVPSKQTATRVLWDFARDLGGAGYHDGIEIQLLVKGGISPAVLTGVTQGNDAPVVVASAPFPAGAAEYSANTDVVVTVSDSAADVVKIKVEYNDDASGGFPATGWKLARPAATPAAEPTPEFALFGVDATVAGKPATFRWDTRADLDGFDADVRMRFTPADDFATGAPVVTAPFRIDNNAPPQAVLDEGAFLVGIKERGNIPVPFQLFDKESDTLKILVQWRAEGQAFPALPTTAAELVDLLENPAREAERKQKQVAVEAPLAFTGRVGVLAGLGPNQVRLPELASTAAGLLAYGLAGRTLEILRPTTLPQPVVWTPNPLNGPVAALPSKDGYTALVLDSSGSGWRLREIDLETGTVVRQVGAGAGAPKALGLDSSRTRVFVGSSTAVFRFDRVSGTAQGVVPHSFADGPRGLAPLGENVVVATGDDKLARFDFVTGGVATAIDGLAEPWGVVADPLHEGSVYLAERAADRVSALDLHELRPRALAAQVAPAEVVAFGSIPFPSPRAIALENRNARLLVMTQFGSLASLRTLDLRSPIDFDNPTNGVADPFVREVTRQLGDAGAAVGAGPDGLRVVSLASANRLAIGGGVSQRRAIVGLPQSAGPQPYVATKQIVNLTEPLATTPGAPWRIQARVNGTSDPHGRAQTFVWDSADAPFPTQVQVRVVPVDGDVGTGAVGTQSKDVRSTFEVVSVPALLPYSVGGHSVVTADLDGDGDLDLVATNRNAQNLTVYFQGGSGVFTPSANPLATVGFPVSVGAADLDGDGDLDLVSANYGTNDLTLFFQGAPGVFVPAASTLALGGQPSVVVAADLDGDGDIDLACGRSLFFQDQPGVFPPSSTVLPNPVAFAVDWDADGDIDLVSPTALTVSVQGPPGVFTTSAVQLPSGVLGAWDMDRDGDLDLVAAGFSGLEYGVRAFLQEPSGVFTPGPLTSLPIMSVDATTAADIDADGYLDLVLALGHDPLINNRIAILRQSAPGAFTASGIPLPGQVANAVATADLDGDGDLDLIAAIQSITGSDSLVLFLQNSPGSFVPGPNAVPTSSSPGGATFVVAADLDGDGDLDLVSARSLIDYAYTALVPSGDWTLALQRAPGVFLPGEPPINPLASDEIACAAADLDCDGDLDLVTANYGSNDLTLLFQSAPGIFTPGASPLSIGYRPLAVVAADLDSDGDLDLVSANHNSSNLTLFFQSAPGVFTPSATLVPTGSNPRTVAAADLDGDGDVDLVSANSGSNTLRLFFQTSPGVFTSGANPLSTGSYPYDVAVADLDGDGDLDLVSANGNNLTLFFQTSPGVFTPAANPLSTSSPSYHVAVADLDGDGDLDLVSAGGNTLMLFFQNAPGIFLPGTSTLQTSGGISSFAAADLDGDGDIDLVTTNGNSNTLTLFFGGR